MIKDGKIDERKEEKKGEKLGEQSNRLNGSLIKVIALINPTAQNS